MAAETLRPDVQLSCGGLVTCDVLEHDDDPDISSVTINATSNNVNTEYGVDFPTPTGNPTVGAGLQEFKAGVIEFDSGQSGTPDARIELWENGSLVRAGSNVPVSVYAVLSFTWNANELVTADGSLVQCKVIGTKSGGSPSARNTVRIGHIEWNAEVDAGGTTFFETLTATATGIAEVTKGVGKTLSVAAIAQPTFKFGFFQTLTATAVGVTNIAKRVGKILSVTAVSVATLARSTIFPRTLTATASGVAILTPLQIVGQVLTATAIGIAGLTVAPIFVRVLAAASIGVATVSKLVGKTLSAVSVGVPSLIKTTKKNLVATAIGNASLVSTLTAVRTITTLAIGVVTLATVVTITGANRALTRLLTLLGVR